MVRALLGNEGEAMTPVIRAVMLNGKHGTIVTSWGKA